MNRTHWTVKKIKMADIEPYFINKTIKKPKVFISYSHDDENHKIWVKELAIKLRNNGIDAVLDQFTHLGTDLSLFMEQGLSESHKVLCICSSIYNEKANTGISGVNYEKRIICQELMKETSSAWVIPIIRNNQSYNKLPLFLSGLKYISFDEDTQFSKNYYELLEELHGKKYIPPIGDNPFNHNSSVIEKIDEMNQITKVLSSVVNHSGNVKFNYLSNSGKFIIGSKDNEFITDWSTAGHNTIHAYKDFVHAIALTSEEIIPNEFTIQKYDFSSRARTASIGDTVIWINNHGKILLTKIDNIELENNLKHWVELSYQIIPIIEPVILSDISMSNPTEKGIPVEK